MIRLGFQIAGLLLLPPLLLGIIVKTKAWFAGRRGPPVLQLYFDLAKLCRKGGVISRTTSWVFQAGPLVTLVSVVLAGLLVPSGGAPAPVSFMGDPILFVYLLGLARFFMTAAALDTGSAFEGMGSARELSFACLSEAALLMALVNFACHSGALSLSGMPIMASGALPSVAPAILTAIGLFIVLLAESCRIPVDDPNTHLELTMIHEVMVLDHSGPLFGALLYAASMKFYVLASLLVAMLMPVQTASPWLAGACHLLGLALLAIGVGVVESCMARLRMRHVPTLLMGALLAGLFGFILHVR